MNVSKTATVVVLSFLSASAFACARTACAAKGSAGTARALGGSAAQAATAGVSTTPVRVTSIISNSPAVKDGKTAAPGSKPAKSTGSRAKLAAAKRSHRRGRGSRYHYGTYFVPPPPAYAPQSLPELHFPSSVQPELIEEDESEEEEETAKKPTPTYKKYIYVRDDSLAPKVLEHHKGVTVWRNRY